MAGAMRKMGVYLGLVEDDEPIADDADEAYSTDYRRDGYRSESGSGYGESGYGASHHDSTYADYGDGDRHGSQEPAGALAARSDGGARTPVATGYASTAATAQATHVSPWSSEPERASDWIQERAHERALEQAAAMARITTVHPRTYNEARTIGEQFRSGTPVIMNLTEMDDPDAKRLVDFAAGLTFGLRGSIDRVTNRVFLLSPHNVDVTAEDKARIAEGGFFNQS